MPPVLSPDQIEEFRKKGVLVVDDILDSDQLQACRQGLHATLLRNGVDPDSLEESGAALGLLSSTKGSGGVLDLFYDEWKIQNVATNEKMWHVTRELWQACCTNGWRAPADVDLTRGYCYLDRIGYRLPTALSNALGSGKKGLQRSLTPHLDCCPHKSPEHPTKWRPIQCFVSLVDTLEANHGGFEAAPGFHADFDEWSRNRKPLASGKPLESLCYDEYTHIRPQQEHGILDRVQHVACRAGSAVLWDVRIPHGNARHHHGSHPRAVVYCSFLPDCNMNRKYAAHQLAQWRSGQTPMDNTLWRAHDVQAKESRSVPTDLNNLQRKLLRIDPW